MNLYIYQGVSGITGEYHDGGSLVIVSDRDPNVVWEEYCTKFNSSVDTPWQDPIDPDATKGNLTRMYNLEEDQEEKVYVFPDSGCC